MATNPIVYENKLDSLKAVQMIAGAIEETVAETGSLGASGRMLYPALASYGISLEQFEIMMTVMVRIGRVSQEGFRYFLFEDEIVGGNVGTRTET